MYLTEGYIYMYVYQHIYSMIDIIIDLAKILKAPQTGGSCMVAMFVPSVNVPLLPKHSFVLCRVIVDTG